MAGSDVHNSLIRITDRQRERLQSSLVAILPHYEAVGCTLYAHLFALHPGMRRKFPGNMARYEGAFTRVVMLTVRSLDRLDQVRLVVDDLGRRYASLMLNEDDYRRLGKSLIWALERAHGTPFDSETRTAWQTLFQFIVRCMQEAAAPLQVLHNKIQELNEENDALRQEVFALRRELRQREPSADDTTPTIRLAA